MMFKWTTLFWLKAITMSVSWARVSMSSFVDEVEQVHIVQLSERSLMKMKESTTPGTTAGHIFIQQHYELLRKFKSPTRVPGDDTSPN